MKKIESIVCKAKRIAIAGHLHPDGDCIGSCMAMYYYLRDNYPEIVADVYLEPIRPVFSYLKDVDRVIHTPGSPDNYDLLMLFDVSSTDRIGVIGSYLGNVPASVCIDHHITNTGLADDNHIVASASSTCEVLFELMDKDKISKQTAEALYTGIIHDCGVFQYSNTSPRTMEIGAWLIGTGIAYTEIIENSFYKKTFKQNKILGHVLENCRVLPDSECIVGYVTRSDMERFEVSTSDFEGIVNQMRLTQGAAAAIFLYEQEENVFKVSMRSNGQADVAAAALCFGGGGHKMAAGCTVLGNPDEIIAQLSSKIKEQLEGQKYN